jgi:hypothetical protein
MNAFHFPFVSRLMIFGLLSLSPLIVVCGKHKTESPKPAVSQGEAPPARPVAGELSPAQQDALLDIARQSIAAFLSVGAPRSPQSIAGLA